MDNKRVCIKFCGGCNPRIDRDRIAREIKKYLSEDGYEVFYNSLDADFVVYLSGCTASCASRYSKSDTPYIVIAASTVDAVAMDEEEISIWTVQKVRDHFEQLERSL